jgi:protein SCO1/2
MCVLLLSVSWGWAREGARLAPAKMVRQRIEGRAPELALVDQSGQPLTLTALRGRVVLLTFTYSACADVCPLITATLAALQQRLTAAERRQVFFLSVTTQPAVDTPAVLHVYANRLGIDLASWAFVTGHPHAV